MQQITINDSFRRVLVRWREHRKNISAQVKKSRIAMDREHRTQQRIRLSILGSMFLTLGIALLMLVPDFRRLFGESAELVLLIVFAWGLDLSVIGRRLKGEIEFREKLSAFLVIIVGGASFSSLGAIWDYLVKGHPNPWVIVPTAGLAMTAILLQTLFIAARIKGDLLVCLEEAEELRKRRQSAPVARVDNIQPHGMPPVIRGLLSKDLIGFRRVTIGVWRRRCKTRKTDSLRD